MDEPYLGEIRSIAISYAPKGWAFCNGQLLPINQNQALYSLLGTTYGGDGRTTFGLPDLQGRVPVGIGQGAGLSNYALGQKAGLEQVPLTQSQIPAHVHPITGTIQTGSSPDDAAPANDYPAGGGLTMYNSGPRNGVMGVANGITGVTSAQGGSVGHENRMPFLVTNFVIALQGVYPSRS